MTVLTLLLSILMKKAQKAQALSKEGQEAVAFRATYPTVKMFLM